MATVLEELLIKVGVDVDSNEMKKFENVSAQVATTLNKVAAAGAAAATAIAVYSVKMGRATDSSMKFARSSGIALQSIQELEFAAQREGAAAGELTSTLRNLNLTIGQLAIGGGPRQAIRMMGGLGLSLRELTDGSLKADELLIRIGEAIQGFTPQRQAELVSNFGISPAILQLLQQGRFSIEELRKEARELGFETEAFAKKNEELNDRLLRLRVVVARALIPIREMFIQMAEKWMPRIERWIENNKKLIPQIAKLASILAAMFVASKIIKWTSAIIGATKALFGLAGAFKAVAIAKGAGTAAGVAGVAGGVGVAPLVAGAVAIGATGIGLKRYLDRIMNQPNAKEADFRRIAQRAVNNNSSQTNTFYINGATDPKAVGREVGRILDSRNRNSIKTMESGAF